MKTKTTYSGNVEIYRRLIDMAMMKKIMNVKWIFTGFVDVLPLLNIILEQSGRGIEYEDGINEESAILVHLFYPISHCCK